MSSPFHLRSIALATLCLLLAAAAVLAQDPEDEVRMRNGTVLKGKVIEVDKNTVTLRTGDGPRDLKRAEVRSILFGGEEVQVGEIPPGFTCANGLKILRVITLRRVSDVKNADQGKGEPAVLRISADGSKIAYWSPNDALYTVNHDGTDRKVVWAKGEAPRNDVNGNYLDLSPDGKYVYWLNWWGDPIYRTNSDGSGGQVMISRKGANVTTWRLRQGGKRLFFMDSRGIYSVDTEGKGDFKEVFSRAKFVAQFDPAPYPDAWAGPADYDVSEDGSRVVFTAINPKTEKLQLCTINGDGTGLRSFIVKTEKDPLSIHMSPDGAQIFFWHPDNGMDGCNWAVGYDGTNLRRLPLPYVDRMDMSANRVSADGKWLAMDAGERAGFLLSKTDGSEWFDIAYPHFSLASIPRSVVPYASCPQFDARMKRFVYRGGPNRPYQVVAGEINPRVVEGLPIISDIEFTRAISTNPALPNHVGTLKVRVKAGTGDVLKVSYYLSPKTIKNAEGNWDFAAGHYAMQGEKVLTDDGKNGDETAGDGVYSTNLFGPAPNAGWLAGHHTIRILVHDELGATCVDVDGVEISK